MLLKVSKKEYLEAIVQGRIYFNRADFFRGIEKDTSNDSREGKIRVDPTTLRNSNNTLASLLSIMSPEELNISFRSSRYVPIFCCSVVERGMLVPRGGGEFDLSKAYIREMRKWGNSVLVFSQDEFCTKVYEKCIEQKIIPLMKKITYDQDEHIYSFSEYTELMNRDPLDAFFHKTMEYKNQHEFRVVLVENTNPKNLAPFILNIERLRDAMIFDLERLDDLGLRILSPIK